MAPKKRKALMMEPQERPSLCDGPLKERIQWYNPAWESKNSRRELLADMVVHLVGAGLGCIGIVPLLKASWFGGDPWPKFVGLSVYAFSVPGVFCCSALTRWHGWQWSNTMWHLSDLCGVKSMICGTAIPILMQTSRYRGLAIMVVIGITGLANEVRKAMQGKPDTKSDIVFRAVQHLLMGWTSVFPAGGILWDMPRRSVIIWLLAAATFSCNAILWVICFRNVEFSTPLWHVSVVIGTALWYYLIFMYIVGIPSSTWEEE